jgi:hypothetical protein
MNEQADALLRESKKPEPKSPLNPEFKPALKEPTIENMAGLMYPEQDILSEDDADIAYRLRNKTEKDLLPRKYTEVDYGTPLYNDISPNNFSKEADYLRSKKFGAVLDGGTLGSFDNKSNQIYVLNKESMEKHYPTIPDKFNQVLRHENTHKKLEDAYQKKFKSHNIKGLNPERRAAVEVRANILYGDLLNEHILAIDDRKVMGKEWEKKTKKILGEMYPLSHVGNYTKNQSSNSTEELFARLVEQHPKHILKADTKIAKNTVRLFFP